MSQILKSPSQPHLFFVYIREFGYYILLGACRNEGNHFQTTKDNQTYLKEHNLQKNINILLHHAM